MTSVAAGTGSVTHSGQGTLSYDAKTGRVSRTMANGISYYADPGDEKYDALYNEYLSGLNTNQTAANSALNTALSTGAYSDTSTAPTYTDNYSSQISDKLDEILDRQPFSYDASSDPSYAAYRKEYLREGDRAYRDALGQASAKSGGNPSSYAYAAASQSRDYYNSQLADKIPELYENAYNRYLQEYNLDQEDLSALRNLRSDDLSLYQIQLGQYNTDRDYGLNEYSTNYNVANSNAQLAQSAVDSAYEKEYNDAEQAYEQAYNNAVLAAQYGDYSGLQALGIDTSAYTGSTSSKVGSSYLTDDDDTETEDADEIAVDETEDTGTDEDTIITTHVNASTVRKQIKAYQREGHDNGDVQKYAKALIYNALNNDSISAEEAEALLAVYGGELTVIGGAK